MITEAEFVETARTVSMNARLLDMLPELGLDQCYLTAGCLFQPTWNLRSDRPADWGIQDFDVFYYDDSDLSWEAEDRVIQHASRIFGDDADKVEIRNQARVHLWYEQKFGTPTLPLKSSPEGVQSFLVACTCVGINVATGELFAPFGLEDLWNGRLAMTRPTTHRSLFLQKCASYRDRWPWLTVVDDPSS